MKPYYSDVFQFRGSHYDFGYFQGELLRDSPILPNRERQWRPREKRHFIVNTETSIKFLKEFAPQILDEIRGIADALSLDIKEALKDRKSTRLNSSHVSISYAVFCLKKKKNKTKSN